MSAEMVLVPSVVLDRFAALGVDVARLLRRAEIPPSRFAVPRVRLSVAEFFAFWNALGEFGRDLGLRIGSDVMPHQFDVASLSALHSPNLHEGLKKMARYKRLVCAETMSIDVEAGEGRVGFHWIHMSDALPLLLVDATFSSILMLARRGTGSPITPLRVELARRRQDEAALRQHFGCAIEFDAPSDRLVFAEAALKLPFITHNADLLEVMLPGLEAALNAQFSTPSLVEDVRAELGRCMRGERPSVEMIAARLHISPRTLQRRLQEAGTSYQRILDDVRRDTARRLLSHTDLETGEVAFVLGFEELNSFSRAFHGWEGVTPLRFREFERQRA